MSYPVDLNGTIMPEKDAVLPANSRAVAYGEGCFETIRSYKGKFLRLEAHIDRLNLGLQKLNAGHKAHPQKIKERILRLLDETGESNRDFRIRIQAGSLGKAGVFGDSGEIFTLITATPIDVTIKPVSLTVAEIRKIPTTSLDSSVKWSQYVSNMMALRKAKTAGFDDAIMLTQDGFVSETTIANIFWIKGDKIFTPSQSCDMLPGITRQIILDALKVENISLTETKAELRELSGADSVSLTNSVREIQAVSALNGKEFDQNNPILEVVKQAFEKLKEKELC